MTDLNTRIVISATDKTGAAFGKARKGIDSISRQLGRLRVEVLSVFAVSSALRGGKALADLADRYKLVNARVKLVTGSAQEYIRAQQALFQIAQDTRSPLEATTTLYARLGRNTKQLGVSQNQLLTVTRTINQAMQVSIVSESSLPAIYNSRKGKPGLY